MGSFEVINPGLLTTVQDEGRFEHQQSGVCVAGVMDPFAHKVANILCGNANLNEAVLEASMMGPTLTFNDDAYIAITGADLSPAIDGLPVKTWQSFIIKAGSTLSFGGMVAGARAYIGIYGGMDIPVVMGSKSTYAKAKIGGYEGRPLQKGDSISYSKTYLGGKAPMQLPPNCIPAYEKENTLRVVLGPQDDAFTAEGIGTFLSSCYTVSNEADRMGYRLEGGKIQHKDSGDIISDGMIMGAVQIPGQGQPIILMADRQTTGGYTKIAAVIYADLYKVAQAKPGDLMRFSRVSIEEAQDIYIEFHRTLDEIAGSLQPAAIEKPPVAPSTAPSAAQAGEATAYDLWINGEHHSVSVQRLT